MRTKLVNCDEFSGHRFEDTHETVNVLQVEDDPVEEETILKTSSGLHETHPTSGRRVTGKTTIAVHDLDQVHDKDSQLLSGDGKQLHIDNETSPGTTTDQSKKYNLKCEEEPFILQAFPFLTRRLPVLRMTATVLDWWIKIPVLLAQGKKELNLKDPCGQTKEANIMC